MKPTHNLTPRLPRNHRHRRPRQPGRRDKHEHEIPSLQQLRTRANEVPCLLPRAGCAQASGLQSGRGYGGGAVMYPAYTGKIRCPHCGTVNEYTNETCWHVDGDSLEMLCKRCGERIEPHGGER